MSSVSSVLPNLPADSAQFEPIVYDASPFGEMINAERSANALNPLQPNAKLITAAQKHADDMSINGYFSHTSEDGRSFGDRLRDEGYAYCWAAENIAAGYTSVSGVFNAWMDSPGHEANMMNTRAAEFGLGYASSGHYWVLNLGRSSGC